MRRKNNNSSRTIVSSKYLNVEQIDNICNILTDRYIEELSDNDTLLRQIDIEDFAKKMLGCTIVYESMEDSFINDEKERIRGYFYHDPTPVEELDVPANKLLDPAFAFEANETAAFIINKMRSLPRTEGRRLYMKYVLGLETDEIARLEKVCPEAIRNSLRRGLAHVYQLFENSEVINNDKNN